MILSKDEDKRWCYISSIMVIVSVLMSTRKQFITGACEQMKLWGNADSVDEK